MTPTYLLDSSVLIAASAQQHVHHERAVRWAATVERFATCPVVEGALIRFSIRLGAHPAEPQRTLQLLRDRRGFEFWPDAVTYADADLSQVRGHRQVTDAYLVALARERRGVLATLDEDLAKTWPEQSLLLPT